MSKRSLSFLLLAACTALPVLLNAQPIAPKAPAYFEQAKQPQKRAIAALPPGRAANLVAAPEFAFAPLTEAESASVADVPTRIGVHRDTPAEMLRAGQWDLLEDGSAVWRLVVRSPGSRGIRVNFEHFAVGAGKVWVYGDNGLGEPLGPYTGDGINGNGQFWSGTVFGEAIALEYVPGQGSPLAGSLPFAIRSISHQVVDLQQAASSRKGPDVRSIGGCHLDANCYPEWQNSMHMVAEMIYEKDDGQYACTGSLISTRGDSFKPYLLSAGHCISDEKSASSLQTYWFYETQSCNGAPPPRPALQSEVGATLLAHGNVTQGDFSFVQLRGVPSGVWFSGWDPNDPIIGTPVTAIHHPGASWKRISFGKRVPGGSTPTSVDGFSAPAELYYQVRFDQGRVEPGSSGSPLFTGPGVLVGSLSYAPVIINGTACELADFVAGYSRFSNTYAAIREFLEDVSATEVRPAASQLKFNAVNGVAPAPQKLMVGSDSAMPIRFTAVAGASWVQLSASSAETSSSSPAALVVSIDPKAFTRPGAYSAPITLQSGGAPAQTVMVIANISYDRSSVTLTVTPDPVYEDVPDLQGFRWFYDIRLEESAGVDTRLTVFRIDDIDFSNAIPAWFGSDKIAAMGRLSAGVRAKYEALPHEQVIEVGGVDAISGQRWNRVTVIKLLPAR